MRTKILFIAFFLEVLLAPSASSLNSDEIKKDVLRSVVHICKPGLGCGTGALLDDGRILTALHVLSEGCWSSYCDSYELRVAEKIGEEPKIQLPVNGLLVDRIFPGLDAAILRSEKGLLPKGVFSLSRIAPLSEEKLYTLDFANNRALRFASGKVVQNRITFASTDLTGGKGSSGAAVFDEDLRLLGIRVAAASWKDAIRGLALPLSKGAITPAVILKSVIESEEPALRIAEGLNRHHAILRECPPEQCLDERAFFIGHVVEFSYFLGELSADFNENQPTWYTIFSFFRRAAPTTPLGEALEQLSLAYEIELHIGPMPPEEKTLVINRLRGMIKQHPRSPSQVQELISLLDYADSTTWTKTSLKKPGFLDQILGALWLPLLGISVFMLLLGILLGFLFRRRRDR